MNRRTWLYDTVFAAVAAMPEFRNQVHRVYPSEVTASDKPIALPYIGADRFEDYKYDEGGRAYYNAWQGKTECGVVFSFKGRAADIAKQGVIVTEEARLIDAIEQVIRGIESSKETFDQNGSGGGYSVQIDYVIPRGNDVVSIDTGTAGEITASLVSFEIGWTQTHD